MDSRNQKESPRALSRQGFVPCLAAGEKPLPRLSEFQLVLDGFDELVVDHVDVLQVFGAGEKAVVIGSVRGVQNLVTIGNICGHWESRKIRWILFSAPVSAGASGGPLINDKGEVTGIVIGSYNNMQNLNLAAPVSILEEYHKAGEF